MKKTVFALLLACFSQLVSAQWTLDRCIAYALEHNLTVGQRKLDQQAARQQVVAAKDAVLPQVSAGASQNWNFGRSLNSQNIYENHNTANFGINAGLQLPLFNGLQTLRNIEYSEAWLRAAVENVEATKDDVTLNVMAQYLQVLYASEIEGVARAQAELTAEELQSRQALFDAGKIPEADMLDARSQHAQAKLELVNAANQRQLALLDLAQLLRLESLDGFDVVALDDENPAILDAQEVYNAALGANHSIRAGELDINAALRREAVAKTGYIPRLNFQAGLSSNYYRLPGVPNDGFAAQMRHNFGQYVGFQLNIPIFDGFQTRNSLRSARIQTLSAELQQETRKDQLWKAISENYYQAIGAKEQLAAAEEASAACGATLAAVQEKYNLGRAKPVDFENAKNAFVRAMSQRAQARYQLILRARILAFYARR